MAIEMPKRKIIFIDSEPPDGDPKYFAWIDTVTRTVKVYEDGQWIIKASLAEEGYTGVVTITNKQLTFENGLLKQVVVKE